MPLWHSWQATSDIQRVPTMRIDACAPDFSLKLSPFSPRSHYHMDPACHHLPLAGFHPPAHATSLALLRRPPLPCLPIRSTVSASAPTWNASLTPMATTRCPSHQPLFRRRATPVPPAGAQLVACAAARSRKQPSGWDAWLAVAMFGLVDAPASNRST